MLCTFMCLECVHKVSLLINMIINSIKILKRLLKKEGIYEYE